MRRLTIVDRAQLLIASYTGAFRRKSFPAVIIATGASDGRVCADNHVAELSGRAALAAIDLTVKNNSGTDALRNENQNEITRVAHLRSTEPKFSQGYRVSIIINDHRQTGRRRDYFCHG